MNWLYNLDCALDYIEQNLTGKIDINEICKICCCSKATFYRMFTFISNITINEYIRYRRLTLAAADLQDQSCKIIDVATKYGYNFPASFSRAFQSFHGFLPKDINLNNTYIKSYPRIKLEITISGTEQISYRTDNISCLRAVGVKVQMDITDSTRYNNFPILCDKLEKEGILDKIEELNNLEPKGLIGISSVRNGNLINYFICTSTNLPCPNDMEEVVVPSGLYAIFSFKESSVESFRNTSHYINKFWLNYCGYKYRRAPIVEFSIKNYSTKKEIWIPIKRIENN